MPHWSAPRAFPETISICIFTGCSLIFVASARSDVNAMAGAGTGVGIHAGTAGHDGDLWDMAALRASPVVAEPIGQTRLEPLATPAAVDWMHAGDAWVAAAHPGEDSAAQLAAGSPSETLEVREWFLSTERTPTGPDRVYCAVARPVAAASATRVPVILVFHGGGGHASIALALATARRHPGMAAVAMDYNGQHMPGTAGRVTEWKTVTPEMRERRLDLVPDLRRWPMYHYVMAARRTIDWIETQPWADATRVGAVGISYGGWVALLLAGVDARVICVTTAVSAGGAGFTAGRAAQQLRWEPASQRPLWLANYEPMAYAARTRAAVFFQLATNDLFFWLNGAERHLAALPGPKGWMLRPNSNHGSGGPEMPDGAAPAFMRHVLAGGPSVPEVLDFRAEEHGHRFRWTLRRETPETRCVLTWSPGAAVSPGRYWIEFPATKRGGEWTAELPAAMATWAGLAYVNAGDGRGVVISSPLLHLPGSDPHGLSDAGWPGGQVWDTERAAAAWRMPAGWMAKTTFAVDGDGFLHLAPEKGETDFLLLTNSVAVTSGAAASRRGLRVRLDGLGEPGVLKISFLQDTNSLDERRWTSEVAYPPGLSEHVVTWDAFKPAANSSGDGPPHVRYDGLTLSGTRASGAPLVVRRLEFAD